MSGYVHLFSPAIGEDGDRKSGSGLLGKDVVFVGCESKLSVWWKPTRQTPKHTTDFTFCLYCLHSKDLIRLLGVQNQTTREKSMS